MTDTAEWREAGDPFYSGQGGVMKQIFDTIKMCQKLAEDFVTNRCYAAACGGRLQLRTVNINKNH